MTATPDATQADTGLTEGELAMAHAPHKSPDGIVLKECHMCKWYVVPAVESIIAARTAAADARLADLTEGERELATVNEAIAAWEAKGPTSLTVALMAEALYGVRGNIVSLAARIRDTFPGTLGLDLADEVIATLVRANPTDKSASDATAGRDAHAKKCKRGGVAT